MKKLIAIWAILLLAQTNCMAINYDTTVTVAPIEEIDADKVKVGDIVKFRTIDDITYNDRIEFEKGTEVYGVINKKKNNFIFGKPGIIYVGNFQIQGKNGTPINLVGNAINMGTARYWTIIPGVLLCLPFLFIKGNDGKITPNNYYTLQVP